MTTWLGQKRPAEPPGGAVVSYKKPKQELVAVSGRENAKQIIQSVGNSF